MTHTDEDREAVQQKIDDYADERGRIIETGRHVRDGITYVYPRMAAGRRGIVLSFMDDIEGDVREAGDVLKRSIDYQIEAGVITPSFKTSPQFRSGDTQALTRISENDAKAIHDALLDTLPVTTYALLREHFATLGGRVKRP